ncbi:MAG TPA: hypothetical protein VMR50_15630 [Myxococcota bacterium]|nr:hypothetical protein [Myxococcota bacterium]
MRKLALMLLALSVSFWLAGQGSAGSLTMTGTDDRLVDIRCFSCGYSDLEDTPASPFGSFEGSVSLGESFAKQTSDISSHEISASGSSYYFPIAEVQIQDPLSIGDLHFTLDQASWVSLTADVATSSPAPVATLYFCSPDCSAPAFASVTAGNLLNGLPYQLEQHLDFAQILAPGSYELAWGASQTLGAGMAAYSFDLTVPEPAPNLFLALSSVALLVRRRRYFSLVR